MPVLRSSVRLCLSLAYRTYLAYLAYLTYVASLVRGLLLYVIDSPGRCWTVKERTMKAFIGRVVCAAALVAVAVTPGHAASQAAAVGKPSGADARISQRLKADPTLKKYNIKVSVEGNIATLSGTVPTEADRAKAGELAKVNGITRVDNQLVVDLDAGTTATSGTVKDKAKEGSQDTADKVKGAGEKTADAAKQGVSKTGEAITDGWITTRIKGNFVNEAALKNSDIRVTSDKHVVTLSGTVTTEAARARAVEIAKGTEGVKNVVDKLTIGPKKE
jgi:hyperosmotically inducible periplasmic protein